MMTCIFVLMMRKLEDYRQFVDKNYVERVRKLARPLKHTHLLHINSTFYGGGVAEILNSMVMLLNDGRHQGRMAYPEGQRRLF